MVLAERFDKLGVAVALIGLYSMLVAPFVIAKPNRIVQGQGIPLHEALAAPWGYIALGLGGLLMIAALLRSNLILRLVVSLLAVLATLVVLGASATFLTPENNSFARVSPASGFWLTSFAFVLVAADAIGRLRLKPFWRVAALIAALAAFTIVVASGNLADISVMKEYASQAGRFHAEIVAHLVLALGSTLAAVVIGIPFGLVCYKIERLRGLILNILNIVQTIPSIALFGILIAPLAWAAANVPGASAIGISGIGKAPAFVALFLYALLPITSNTVIGLQSVRRATKEAARGMGMTAGQRLARIEFPLAFPVILTGIRIVLVQNIGLATIAALIGGGGLGVFVFQGIGQTAMDLVLLGAAPTVALAFSAAILLDALTETLDKSKGRAS
ncbi:ABC transporter permease [Limoniibacter endophyticus]|uniref:ABC transporter permease n=1 Tax=Limoniibacter endophyticus TaxID=1565040 RepID=A0A8J3DLL2_9HYPH|nr:ABC transporter permease [Limoniibacter endophyticus]GHC79773.1 ABC transporter permease [Limoniibacter endophyticus]